MSPRSEQYVLRPPTHSTPGEVDPRAIWVTPRSMSDVLFVAAHFVHVPVEHAELVPALESVPAETVGTSPVRILSSDKEPPFPYRVRIVATGSTWTTRICIRRPSWKPSSRRTPCEWVRSRPATRNRNSSYPSVVDGAMTLRAIESDALWRTRPPPADPLVFLPHSWGFADSWTDRYWPTSTEPLEMKKMSKFEPLTPKAVDFAGSGVYRVIIEGTLRAWTGATGWPTWRSPLSAKRGDRSNGPGGADPQPGSSSWGFSRPLYRPTPDHHRNEELSNPKAEKANEREPETRNNHGTEWSPHRVDLPTLNETGSADYRCCPF